MTTTEIGRFGEKLAAKHLKRNHYKIIAKNSHQSHNELDIVAVNKDYIVFVEVKTRSVGEDLYSEYGTPAMAVTLSKQRPPTIKNTSPSGHSQAFFIFSFALALISSKPYGIV